MKILILILALLVLSNCTTQRLEIKSDNAATNSSQLTSPGTTADSHARNSIPLEANKIDNAKPAEMEAQNEKFRAVPDEFKGVDFKNFRYPEARLKNGEYDERGKKYVGGTDYSFDDAFYLDLNGDGKKEAVVFLSVVQCGASCDGGADYIYFFSSQNGKPELLDEIQTGSRSGGCSLRSFTIKDKKIFIEQFGRCRKKSNQDENGYYSCKFCVKDLTRSVYSIEKGESVKKSSEITETPEVNVMGYQAEISISE